MFMSNFPENLKQREDYIFSQVIIGKFEARWVEINYSFGEKLAKFYVMSDALKIDGVRVNVSATLQQRLADIFDASLLTPLLADLIYVSATSKALPCPMPISSNVDSMIKHSKNVDAQIGSSTGELVSTVGKHWVLDKKLSPNSQSACNYGWHFTGSSFQGIKGFSVASKLNTAGSEPVRVIQPNATAHDRFHSDYSQICQLVSQRCWVDGTEYRFSEILQHPELSSLVSHDGPLNVVRQPGTTKNDALQVFFPIAIDERNENASV